MNATDNTGDFISLASEAALASGLNARFRRFVVGDGVQIVHLTAIKTAPVTDLDRFLIEITSLADRKNTCLQLSLAHNDPRIKNDFQRYGFKVVDDAARLEMERVPDSAIQQSELDFVTETAPPGDKAEHFIKKHKKEFKNRYGKRWKTVLYATAWKKFSESASLRDCFFLIETFGEH